MSLRNILWTIHKFLNFPVKIKKDTADRHLESSTEMNIH